MTRIIVEHNAIIKSVVDVSYDVVASKIGRFNTQERHTMPLHCSKPK